MVQEIEISKLKIHPKNVRKTYNGIAELAESIKAKGVLQNLTVVPDPDEDGTYFVVVGNRRLTAARVAGVETLPCVIAEMDEKEQAETMLLENMQRDDLSIYEQAQGFQMVLDLGETEDELAEKTGFSKTTVRRRVNIAKLDQNILQQRERDGAFQLSLTDLYELEKIKDVKKRNQILETAQDSKNISFKVSCFLAEEKRQKAAKKLNEMLEKAGIHEAPEKASNEMYTNKWETVKKYPLDDENLPNSIDVDTDGKETLYRLKYWNEIRVIRKAKKEKKELTPAEIERAEKDSRKKRAKAMIKEMEKTRREFILDIITGKVKQLKGAEKEQVERVLWEIMLDGNAYITKSAFVLFLKGQSLYEMPEDEQTEAKESLQKLSVIDQELIAAHHSLESLDFMDYNAEYNASTGNTYKKFYEALSMYGFSLENDETNFINGTHEMYKGPQAAELQENGK